MRKKIILGMLLGVLVLGGGCNANIGKTENVIEFEKKEKYRNLENEIGLENIDINRFAELIDSLEYMSSEYKLNRQQSLKASKLNKKNIDEIVERAIYLINNYNREMPKYFYVQTINEIDLLGEYISLDLAVELLKECIFSENIDEMKSMIIDEDFKIYWYTYVSELLSDFYQENKQVKQEEKNIIIDYLRELKAYPILIVSSKAEKSDFEMKMIEDSSKKLVDLKNEVNYILSKN
ncbi:hypothetical protein [uncultured Clostridium sp.]|uniref:hypothetical protein n=1 Tax=uncultured Clostridium sp. TaxID=59620 RepID=UPI002636FC79|nr:hypothetical protein [uncultured Clostridium sp.]